MRYAHTNLIARDWNRLANFYIDVFGCRPVPPERRQSGAWLARGTGVENAALEGVHLRLPGHGDGGPTLEIYTYNEILDSPPGVANRRGFGHLAFEVADVGDSVSAILEQGGSLLGEITTHAIDGVGCLTFVYARDPEGNVLEIQSWS